MYSVSINNNLLVPQPCSRPLPLVKPWMKTGVRVRVNPPSIEPSRNPALRAQLALIHLIALCSQGGGGLLNIGDDVGEDVSSLTDMGQALGI